MLDKKPGSWFSFKDTIEDMIGIFIIFFLIILGSGLFFATFIGVIKAIKWLAR